jgi:ABC-type nitrate/sulfonate/bicarbonate transport system substrate-binding protein
VSLVPPTTERTLWYTRCPVPTAIGIAAQLGWLDPEFGADGWSVRSLQDAAVDGFDEEHFSHGIPSLIREGGNVPALWTRARGQRTRLVGLTWVDERQAILTRADDSLEEPGELVGRRVGIPLRRGVAIDFWRAMALGGFAGAMSMAGHALEDLKLVDVVVEEQRRGLRRPDPYPELEALRSGIVDAVYVKGAPGVEAAERTQARVAIDLDQYGDRRTRVNNGTPRPITVHQDLLDTRRDLVIRFLAVLLRAADWAADDPGGLAGILSSETWSGVDGVRGAYRRDGRISMHPDLSDERMTLLDQQERFLFAQGFLARHVDVSEWADPGLLAEAQSLRLGR